MTDTRHEATTNTLPVSTLTKKQKKSYGPRAITYSGEAALITAEVRFDDECGNGHNTFSITGTIRATSRKNYRTDNGFMAGGCLHEEIAKHFPELAPFIKWHLVSTDYPMHYYQNTVFFAGNRDCWGRAAGEPSAFEFAVKFGDFPIWWRKSRGVKFIEWLDTIPKNARQGLQDFEVIGIDHDDRKTYGTRYTLGGFAAKWHECPFETEAEALEFLEAMKLGFEIKKIPTAFSEGKARELDNARSASVWPEATDEELTAPGIEERLEARLPKLMSEFKDAVEFLGFVY